MASFVIPEDIDGHQAEFRAANGAQLVELAAAVIGVLIGDVNVTDRAARILGVLSANPGVNIGEVSVMEADPYTTPTHTAVNVTNVTGEVLAANASRRYALLVNDSDTVIYIALGAVAVANQGIRLNSGGGSYEMSLMAGNLYLGAINGIHAGNGNKLLLITEGV